MVPYQTASMRSRDAGTDGIGDGLHGRAEERSLALHREVARRLVEDPAVVARARERVRGWLADDSAARGWATVWLEELDRPVSEIASLLCDPGPRARALRQCSPFAGVLGPRERWTVLRRARAEGSLAPPEERR